MANVRFVIRGAHERRASVTKHKSAHPYPAMTRPALPLGVQLLVIELGTDAQLVDRVACLLERFAVEHSRDQR